MRRLTLFGVLVVFALGCNSSRGGRGGGRGLPDAAVSMEAGAADAGTDGNGAPDANPRPDASADSSLPDTGAPTRDASTTAYQTCSGAADCASPTSECIGLSIGTSGAMGMMCTRRCSADAECPEAGRCFLLGSESICYRSCTTGSECPAGWGCIDGAMTGLSASVCLPT